MKAETRQKLFNYMSNEHGLHLLENELDEIERILGDKVEFAKAKYSEQRKLCQEMYNQDLEIAGNYFYCDSRYFINSPTPDFK